MIGIKKPRDYEEATSGVVAHFQRWPTLSDAQKRNLICMGSALDHDPDEYGYIRPGEYPISGSLLLDIIEVHGEQQATLAELLGVDRNVIFRRIRDERKARGR